MFQCHVGHLADAQHSGQRMFLEDCDQILAADDDARLGAADQLVAAETDQVRAGGDAFRDGRFMGQSEATQVHQGAAAEVVDDQQSRFCLSDASSAIGQPPG